MADLFSTPWSRSGATFFSAYAKQYGLKAPQKSDFATYAPGYKPIPGRDPILSSDQQAQYEAALKKYGQDLQRVQGAAQAASDRRFPNGKDYTPDYTDALMQRVKSAEIVRLGIGKTRQSTFTLAPGAAILSGY